MANELMDNYMETLAGYIYDDDRMVTYKWLSKELEVHVNIAKDILWEFWQLHKKKEDMVSTFLLIGHLISGGMRVEVVRETNLSKAKEKFSTVMSEHIYSLQKTLPDLELLALAGEGDCRFSAIRCKESVLRSEEQLRALHWGSLFDNQPPVTSDEKTSLPEKSSEKESCTASTSKSNVVEKKAPVSKKNVNAQKNAFNNFFGKTAGQQKDANLSSSSNTVVRKAEGVSLKSDLPNAANNSSTDEIKSTSSTKSLQRNAFNSFFGKAVSQEKNSESTSSKALTDNTKEKSENCATINKEKDRSIVDANPSSPVTNRSPREQENNKNINNSKRQAKSSKSTKTGRGKKRQRSKESSDATKKRKRIIIASDSSEESCTSEEEPEEPVERPPLKESIPSPPCVKHVSGRRMVRKTVDKTFQDEDGFFVTQKVHVYESCSEDEAEPVKVKKPAKSPPQTETNHKTKNLDKKNTKQTKLTNFFKKS